MGSNGCFAMIACRPPSLKTTARADIHSIHLMDPTVHRNAVSTVPSLLSAQHSVGSSRSYRPPRLAQLFLFPLLLHFSSHTRPSASASCCYEPTTRISTPIDPAEQVLPLPETEDYTRKQQEIAQFNPKRISYRGGVSYSYSDRPL